MILKKNYLHSIPITIAACSALGSPCNTSKGTLSEPTMMDIGEMIVKILKFNNPSDALTCQALLCLNQCTNSNCQTEGIISRIVKNVAENNGAELVIKILRKCIQNQSIATQACAVIANFACFDEIISPFLMSGLSEILVSCLRKHLHHSLLVQHCSRAISILSLDVPTSILFGSHGG